MVAAVPWFVVLCVVCGVSVFLYFCDVSPEMGRVLVLVLLLVLVPRCCAEDREDSKWELRSGRGGEEKRSTRKIAFTPTTLRVDRGPRVSAESPIKPGQCTHPPQATAAAEDVGQFELKPHHSDRPTSPHNSTTPRLGAAQSTEQSTEHRAPPDKPDTTIPGRIAPGFASALPATLSTISTISFIFTTSLRAQGGPATQHSSQDVARNVAVQRQRHLCVESPSPTITAAAS